MATKFFTFSQNNSGGVFIDDGAIGEYVIIEATDADDANNRAMALGIYFNGVDEERDCECCGDRWSEAYGEGDEVPSKYGLPLSESNKAGWFGNKSYIHFINGEVQIIE